MLNSLAMINLILLLLFLKNNVSNRLNLYSKENLNFDNTVKNKVTVKITPHMCKIKILIFRKITRLLINFSLRLLINLPEKSILVEIISLKLSTKISYFSFYLLEIYF